MATINTILPVVCDDIEEYNRLLNALIAGTRPDVVSYVENLETLTIEITISAITIIP